MGDFELATANLECALDINRANRTAIRLLVEWSWLDQDFSPVIRRLQAYVANEGNEDAEICFHFAKILTQVGRFADARLEMERVLALDPAIESGEALAKALDREIAQRAIVATEEN
jgi:tetratricopeptide (TPR) repeat protein